MVAPSSDPAQLLSLLDFYVAAGIDLALDEEPHDRFAESAQPRLPEPASPRIAEPHPPEPAARDRTRALPSIATAPPAELAEAARLAARDANTLADLESTVAAFEGSLLKRTAKQLIFSDGDPTAPVLLLGWSPAGEEDRAGRLFVGKTGLLLDRMLATIGLDRMGVYLANVVPWRPPGDRSITPQEVAICLPFTLRQIELARPRFIVTLGAEATRALGISGNISTTRGRWHDYAGLTPSAAVLPMLHPAYLLRQPLDKRLAWRDLRLLRRALDGDAVPPPLSGPEPPARERT